MDIPTWIAKVKQLTRQLNIITDDYNVILTEWDPIRDESAKNKETYDSVKEEIDTAFTKLSEARAGLCALKGGKSSRHSSRVTKRSRKHRR